MPYKGIMLAWALLTAAAAAAALFASYIWGDGGLWRFYSESLRGNLFSGMFSAAAFMLSLLTFTIVSMHAHLYSSPGYRRHVKVVGQVQPVSELYDPLRKLMQRLVAATSVCLVAAVFQLTLGIIPTQLTAALAIGGSAAAAAFLANGLLEVARNLQRLITEWQKEADQEEEAAKAASRDDRDRPGRSAAAIPPPQESPPPSPD
jgi:hypothetical protein